MIFLKGTTYICADASSSSVIYDRADYNQAWSIDVESASRGYSDFDISVEVAEGDNSDSDPDSDTESQSSTESGRGDGDDGVIHVSPEVPLIGQATSEAYTEFLQFLELGCSGSPVEGYPLVLVVLAGIPKSVWFTSYILSSALNMDTRRFFLLLYPLPRLWVTKRTMNWDSIFILSHNFLLLSGRRLMRDSSTDEQQPCRGSWHSLNASSSSFDEQCSQRMRPYMRMMMEKSFLHPNFPVCGLNLSRSGCGSRRLKLLESWFAQWKELERSGTVRWCRLCYVRSSVS